MSTQKTFIADIIFSFSSINTDGTLPPDEHRVVRSTYEVLILGTMHIAGAHKRICFKWYSGGGQDLEVGLLKLIKFLFQSRVFLWALANDVQIVDDDESTIEA